MGQIDPELLEKIKKEPNWDEFEEQGYKCIISRVDGGNLNGYVGVPKTHHLYGKDYSDKIYTNKTPKYIHNPIEQFLDLSDEEKEENYHKIASLMEVHGGVTYSRNYLIDEKGEKTGEDLWWFGFDTGHSVDLQPYLPDTEDFIASLSEDDPLKNLYDNFKHIIDEGKENKVYRDYKYVKSNVIKLAENLKYYE